MTAPLVSVAIPAYNHAQFVEACLASVCAQTYPELELILLDDGSRDTTFSIADNYLKNQGGRFRRVVLARHPNQGVSRTSNDCITACRGEWVHLLGSDDILYPDKIARMQQAIASWGCDGLALAHADVDYIDQTGAHHVRQPDLSSRPPPGPDFAAYRWLFPMNDYVFNPTIALRRETFLAAGGFDPALALEDLDCWLRLSTRAAIGRVPEVLAGYRKHPGNTSRRRLKMLGAQFLTYAKFLTQHADLIADDELRRHYRRNLRRVWKRLRFKQPWLLPQVARAALTSLIRTPRPTDYQRFGLLLDATAAALDGH